MIFNKDNFPKYEDFVAVESYGETQPAHLSRAISHIELDGEILEFGVYKGKTLNHIARLVKPKLVYGFDSFDGLPEDWGTVNGRIYSKNEFQIDQSTVTFEDNVTIVPGYFEDTIPLFVRDDMVISFLHVDCDIYKSAYTVLSQLDKYIKSGTVIVFDELANWIDESRYSHYKEHEWKALLDWVSNYDRSFSILGRTSNLAASIKVS